MEPKMSPQNVGPEMGPLPHSRTPENALYVPEVSGEQLQKNELEKKQETREAKASPSADDGVVASQPLTPTPQHDDTSTSLSDTPLVAADEDLIEMEWVNKAKEIVNSTKADPYAQEHEVSKLQADYLMKRYGKEVKIPNDN